MSQRNADVVVLGAGAAGLAAAREARRRSASVALITPDPPGGDCTFTGCVPSKTLVEAAAAGLDGDTALARVGEVVARIAATETAEVLRAEGIAVIDGRGTLIDAGTVHVEGDVVRAGSGVVLALGARPQLPPIPGLDAAGALTTETLWALPSMPRSLVIVGGGAIGCELAQAFARLGTTVAVVERQSRLLATEEATASAVVRAALERDGVDVSTGVEVVAVEDAGRSGGDDGVVVHLGDGTERRGERLLVAAGRRPNSDRAGLAAAGIRLDAGGAVHTTERLRTNLAGVYAAGDVTARSPFTHAADQMGRLAVANLLGTFTKARFRAERIPRVTFTRPEVAAVGLDEDTAARAVAGAMVAELPLTEHDRAIVAGSTDGYVKLIAGPNPVIGRLGGGRLIGASVVGPGAGEIIAELTLAIQLRAFVGRLAATAHAYPTWSYAVQKTAGQFFTTIDGRTARPARRGPDALS